MNLTLYAEYERNQKLLRELKRRKVVSLREYKSAKDDAEFFAAIFEIVEDIYLTTERKNNEYRERS
ncbi:MAG: hypothetical protein IJ752_06075 [Alphaproteobacteria bacterium]|nr:hypothetical protein [Alphaproteobacteria bacterium]